jgi:hypothetical protein
MARQSEIFIDFNGKKLDLKGWAEEFNVSYIRLYKRYEKQRNDHLYKGEHLDTFSADAEDLFRKLEIKPTDPTSVYEDR